MRIRYYALFFFFGLPVVALAQVASSSAPFPLAGLGPAPVPLAVQQQENRVEEQMQQSNTDPASQLIQAQQQQLQQQQMLQAQQDQAWAEQQQANTLWQEQMDQSQGGTPAGAAVEGAVEIAGGIIQRHRYEQAEQQQELAQQEQYDAIYKAQQDELSEEQLLKQINAKADADIAQLQTTSLDLESVAQAMNAIYAKISHATTREQLEMLKSQSDKLMVRANLDKAEHQSALADLDKLQQRLNALTTSNP
jgi:hypothetical protein